MVNNSTSLSARRVRPETRELGFMVRWTRASQWRRELGQGVVQARVSGWRDVRAAKRTSSRVSAT